jgi:hypothetical protein
MTTLQKLTATVFSVFVAVSPAGAEGSFYFSAGKAEKGDVTKSDEIPFAIGYINQAAPKTIWGLDIAREGTMLDSTWGQDSAVSSAFSFNLLYGVNVTNNEKSRLDVAALLGARESFSSCPDSYLGYQCYADTSPDTKYKVNYGVVVTYTHGKGLFGIRATGESVQALVGMKF